MRDFSGKEIAIYNSNDIKQWNLYGFENEGYLDPDRQVRIYIKDHLGSIRVTLDDKLAVINAQDYDAWGYLLEDKSYNLENTTFKFTGKERDKESGYDYFGARYYDSRIGRWGGVEPLLDKYVSFSPYCYGLNSPMVLKDPNGLWVASLNEEDNSISVTAEEGDNLEFLYNSLGISAEEFASLYNINDIANFSVEAGVTSFNISNFVYSRGDFDINYTNSNCHGFVCFAKGLLPGDENKYSADEHLLQLYGALTDIPKTGDIGVFTFSKEADIKGIIIPRNIPQHSGIFIINNSSGNSQFLNRINTGERVSVSTSTQIFQYFSEDARNYESRTGIQLPSLSKEIKYYRDE
ncbi:MAG: RHS repeat-associated core domain-containing protein [Ignavibacteria bacterium]|nr:RHS repeat-associated core domain-containing protein [Ignavibacteria bacterium]